MAYHAIEDHGIIGDLHTTALVGIDGTIDWCCLPDFDSPSVFGGILDDKIGGWFRLDAEQTLKHSQMYVLDTNVLVTRSYTKTGVGQVQDFMPVVEGTNRKGIHQIIRVVSCVRGEVRYQMECLPAFNYARNKHETILHKEGALFETEGGLLYGLKSPLKLKVDEKAAKASFTLKEGESIAFTFFTAPEALGGNPFEQLEDPKVQLRKTTEYWQQWISKCSYHGRWSEMVYRSALALKLLTFAPTGAIVAAPTMALPEHVGGERNWDYRYTWIRDASFTLYALMRIGYTEEAAQFMEWLGERCKEANLNSDVPLNLMYGIHGDHILPEETLDHLDGYRGSKPVRLGNAAYSQLQLDIYGELMDSIYLFNKYGTPITYELWSNVRRIINWVADNWNQTDEGIWETRGGQKNFVFSRLMCWVALDRASRMCMKHSLPGSQAKWAAERDLIYDEIMQKGWNEELQTFVQHYGSNALDASNLLMPLVKFISPVDPRMTSTLDRTLKELTTDSLVYRYDPNLSPDGLSGDEGTFSICTFWLVEALTRAGRLDEARSIFQRMLGYGNHLGLYGEEIGHHGETLGNFPQAFTHLSLISAAYNLDRALSKKG